MDLEGLGNWMVRRGVLNREDLRRARQRQSLYGGSLDTAVLELGLCDEPSVAACLAESTGLPTPKAEWLATAPTELQTLLPLAQARRLGAQPVARVEDRVEMVTRHAAVEREIADWAGRLDLGARSYIVPEVRFEALLSLAHGTPVPPRFAALLGRIVGRARARQLAEPHGPAARAFSRPIVDTGPWPRRPPSPSRVHPRLEPEPEPDLDVTEDLTVDVTGLLRQSAPLAAHAETTTTPPPTPVIPTAGDNRVDPEAPALLEAWIASTTEPARRRELGRALRRQLGEPAVEQALRRWRAAALTRGSDAPSAILALGELRDRETVPLLIDQLNDGNAEVGKAAQTALLAISCHDFGNARWRWSRWWREWKGRHRIEWLIDALTEKNAELRLQAAQELEEVSGRYFGYHFDLGRREREEARRRWFDWWQSTGKATLG
jgi:hypothetical protein